MKRFRCAVLSVVKHDYVPRGMLTHPRFELVMVADDPDVPDWAHERNHDFAAEFKIPYVRDVERALREYAVDVAIVCSEAERHADLSGRAAKLGKHIVQDKPLATTRESADRLAQAVRAAGVRFLLWNRNTMPAVLQARQMVGAGAVGVPYALHVDFYFAKDAGPPRGTRQRGYPPMDWLAFQLSAHVDGSDGALGRTPIGELANEGIYPLGYVHAILNRPIRRVFARSTTHFHQVNCDHGVEDLASLTLEMDDGVYGSIALGRIGLASHPSGGEIKIHVQGTEGALVVAESRPEVGVYYRGQSAKEARQRRVAGEYDFLLAADYARALDTNTETLLDFPASRAIFGVVEAALESCRTGQVVTVKV
jgi:predicted dehydrogenase